MQIPNQNYNTAIANMSIRTQSKVDSNISPFKKAFEEPSTSDLQKILDNSNEDSKFLALDNLISSLMYCTIASVNDESKKQLSAFSQEDFKNSKKTNTKDTNKSFENYSLDIYGFMGSDFLQEAKLPDNLKFHSSSLVAIKNYLTLPFYEHNKQNGNSYLSNYFDSIDLAGGLNNAFKSIKEILASTDNSHLKESYTKEELLQSFKDNEDFITRLTHDNPLIKDYTIVENNEEKIAIEGIVLLFSVSNYGESYAKSDKSKLGEYGKYLAGLPNSYLESPTILENEAFKETSKKVNKHMLDWFWKTMLGLDK